MSLPQSLLVNIAPLLLCLFMMAVAAALSIVGTCIFHRFVPHRSLKVHNDITGPIFNTLGVVYAVLLGFMVVTVWQGFDRAKLNAEKEVNCLASLYMDSNIFEQEFRKKVHDDIGRYTREVISEWDSLARGEANPGAREAIERLAALYGTYSFRSENEKMFLGESIDKVNDLLDLRIMRLIDAATGVHFLLWFVLIVGGVVTIVFTIFFGTDNLNAKILMSALLAMLISLVLFTTLEFSFPFTGSASVSCEPFKQLLVRLGL